MEPVRNDEITTEFDSDRINALPVFDPAEHLMSASAIAAYVNDFLDEGDPDLIAEALGIAARAKAMHGLTRIEPEALCKALREESPTRFHTILRVVRAVGLRLVVEPIHEPLAPPDDKR